MEIITKERHNCKDCAYKQQCNECDKEITCEEFLAFIQKSEGK